MCISKREKIRGTYERHNRTHKITFVEAQIADAHEEDTIHAPAKDAFSLPTKFMPQRIYITCAKEE
jgi:hypothetical protein